MSDTNYPPEVQAVLDAADRWRDEVTTEAHAQLYASVDAYRKSIAPPEPFDVDLIRHTNMRWDRWMYTRANVDHIDTSGEVWRCTVTPIERVR